MSVVIVGSVALDTVKSPGGEVRDALGGSAIYSAVAASVFTPVQLVGIVGDDFPAQGVELLHNKNIDTTGLKTVPYGKTFRWSGEYAADMNQRLTKDLQLNVFADFHPQLPTAYRRTPYVFLANIDPDLQLEVLEQLQQPKLVVCDTMNIWIETKRGPLERLLGQADVMILNDSEAGQLSGESNLVAAARYIQSLGPEILVIKKGEHGALLFNRDSIFCAPALPLASVRDPTGAGDSFAGGFIGYLAQTGDVGDEHLRRAVVYGSSMASFTVESFSLDKLKTVSVVELDERYRAFKSITNFT